MNDLAAFYLYKNKYTEAETLLKQALAIWEKVLGPDHSDVAASLNNLAQLYKKIGKNDETKEMEERAKGIRSRNQ